MESFFLLNQQGELLLEKHWRGLLPKGVHSLFWKEVEKEGGIDECLPILQHEKYTFVHLKRGPLIYVTSTAQEYPPLLVLEFLSRVADTFAEYFGGSARRDATEASVREYVSTVYELLDEMADNGFPMTTEPNILRDMILKPSLARSVMGTVTGQVSQGDVKLPDGTLSNCPWRRMGVKYNNNEIYFDIVEEIDAVVEGNGLTSSSEVTGQIRAMCQLSGMPDLTLVFQNPQVLDDCSFHPCVRYSRYARDRVISFVPPDGRFQLLKYRVTGGQPIEMPLYVKPQIIYTDVGGKVDIAVGPRNTRGKTLENVALTIPFPKCVTTATLSSEYGSVVFDDHKKVCTWTIGRLPRDKIAQMGGSLSFSSKMPKPDGKPTIRVYFKLPMYSASGLKVDSLNVSVESYRPYKGVRYVTSAGVFQVRC